MVNASNRPPKPPFTEAQLEEMKRVIRDAIQEGGHVAAQAPAEESPKQPPPTTGPKPLSIWGEIKYNTGVVLSSMFSELADGLQSFANHQKEYYGKNGFLNPEGFLGAALVIWCVPMGACSLIAIVELSLWAIPIIGLGLILPFIANGILVYLVKRYGKDLE